MKIVDKTFLLQPKFTMKISITTTWCVNMLLTVVNDQVNTTSEN